MPIKSPLLNGPLGFGVSCTYPVLTGKECPAAFHCLSTIYGNITPAFSIIIPLLNGKDRPDPIRYLSVIYGNDLLGIAYFSLIKGKLAESWCSRLACAWDIRALYPVSIFSRAYGFGPVDFVFNERCLLCPPRREHL